MRIIYLTEVAIDRESGVLHKMNTQIEEWVHNGHEVYVVSIPPSVFHEPNIQLTKFASGYLVPEGGKLMQLFKGSIYFFIKNITSIEKICQYLNEMKPDIIYLREILAFPGIGRVLRNETVVMEGNTLLSKEIEHFTFKAKLLYQLFQNLLYKNVDGFIGVTHEITNSFKKEDKPLITISNGIKITNLTNKPPKNIRPNVVFVGSPNCVWHGVDKYYEMAKSISEADFHLIGPALNIENNVSNFFVHGFMGKDNLQNFYQGMDIAVGSLAMHRNSMEEGCPLKVREYAALGLPVIIAYTDIDFSGQDYVLQLENSENVVEHNIEKIKTFILSWKGRRVDLERIKPLISIEEKEKQRLQFIKEVIELKKVSCSNMP